MGTTCCHKPKGEPLTEFFIRQGVLRWGDDNPHAYRVLDSALVNLKEFYAAIEMVHKETGVRRVWAAIIKVTFARTRRASYQDENFCYKDMSECMGQYYTNCPERILKLLTPTDSLYAQNWRDACWAKVEAKKARPKVGAGTVLQYGGNSYTVVERLPRGYLRVTDSRGNTYRMRPGQVRNATL